MAWRGAISGRLELVSLTACEPRSARDPGPIGPSTRSPQGGDRTGETLLPRGTDPQAVRRAGETARAGEAIERIGEHLLARGTDLRAVRREIDAARAAIAPRLPRLARARRRALLIATCYKGRPWELPGCDREAERMASILTRYRGYDEADIAVLRGEAATRPATLAAIRALVAASAQCDEITLYFAGHGMQVPSRSRAEADGLDECLLCDDGNKIRDKELAALLRPCAARCSLVCVMDCCHSGTITDFVPPDLSTDRPEPTAHRICIAACRDEELALQDMGGRGDLTSHLTRLMRRGCVPLAALQGHRLSSGQHCVVSSAGGRPVRRSAFLD